MKFIISLILLSLLVSAQTAELKEVTLNKYNMYIRGVLKEFSLKPEHENECIIPDWKTDTGKSYIQNETEFINAKDVVAILLKGLDAKMTPVCVNKPSIVQFLKDQWTSAEKKKPKVFLETSSSLRKSFAAPAAKVAAAAGKAKGGKVAVPVPEVKPKFAAFDKYFVNLPKFKTSFHLILKTKMFTETLTFLTCYKNAKGVGEGTKKILTGLDKNLPNILKENPDFIDSFIHLACKWEDLKDGIDSMIKGNTQKDVLQKWQYYGSFIGKLINVIGG